jgi:hypothetical protein
MVIQSIRNRQLPKFDSLRIKFNAPILTNAAKWSLFVFIQSFVFSINIES